MQFLKGLISKNISKKPKQKPQYWLTRFVFLRFLGFIYLIAFLSLANQVVPLIGENGLLPAKNFLSTFHFENKINAFVKLPTIFWLNADDTFLLLLAWAGVILSLIVLIGFANAPLMFIIWLIYLSFVHIGQLWYSYGWEIQLLETGFLAIFLCPLWDIRPFPSSAPPKQVIWLLRWLTFRIYLGAGLIKLRGDSCWRDLTCLYHHYETQPIPNPISRLLHFMPKWFHNLGALWNHFIELIAPFFVFYPGIARHIAGILLISFQFILILSGNLSFLNWLTILPAIACFDDSFFRKVLPKGIVDKAELMSKNYAVNYSVKKSQNFVGWVLVIIVAWLSVPVAQNLLYSHQIMNTSFTRLPLVNTYGAFGSVGKERYELIIEGTADEFTTSKTQWKEYGFKAKPGSPHRQLPIIAPYHYRIDWQIWFAAMQRPEYNPWLLHFIWKLLDNDKDALTLLADNPFPDAPPRYIRVQFYRYQFTKPFDESGAIWSRTYIGQWISPLSKSNSAFRQYIEANGWKS